MALILRVGPYICAEWNFGGLPPWLLGMPGIQVGSDTGQLSTKVFLLALYSY